MCVYGIYIPTYECRCLSSQKRVSDAELQAIVSFPKWELGTELWSSVRAVHALTAVSSPSS